MEPRVNTTNPCSPDTQESRSWQNTNLLENFVLITLAWLVLQSYGKWCQSECSWIYLESKTHKVLLGAEDVSHCNWFHQPVQYWAWVGVGNPVWSHSCLNTATVFWFLTLTQAANVNNTQTLHVLPQQPDIRVWKHFSHAHVLSKEVTGYLVKAPIQQFAKQRLHQCHLWVRGITGQ